MAWEPLDLPIVGLPCGMCGGVHPHKPIPPIPPHKLTSPESKALTVEMLRERWVLGGFV